MKKKFLLSAVCLLLSIITLLGIGFSIENHLICKAYGERYDGVYSKKDLHIVYRRFGCYDGAFAFYMGDSNLMLAPSYEIDGYFFQYTTNSVMYICKEGTIYTIPEAYEKNIIDLKDVKKINYRWNCFKLYRLEFELFLK